MDDELEEGFDDYEYAQEMRRREDEAAELRGTSQCDGLCDPLCDWCSVGHYCPQDCGGGSDCPYNDDFCHRCGNTGWLITCMDDLCHGSGTCMHGDGEQPCPECNEYGIEPNPEW